MKPLPLRPPPIKSTLGRPPPPAVNSTSSVNQTTASPSKTSPAPSVSPSSQSLSSRTPSSVTANQVAQRVPKKGPPLPPRPKPGHPLCNSYTVWKHTNTHTFLCHRVKFIHKLCLCVSETGSVDRPGRTESLRESFG